MESEVLEAAGVKRSPQRAAGTLHVACMIDRRKTSQPRAGAALGREWSGSVGQAGWPTAAASGREGRRVGVQLKHAARCWPGSAQRQQTAQTAVPTAMRWYGPCSCQRHAMCARARGPERLVGSVEERQRGRIGCRSRLASCVMNVQVRHPRGRDKARRLARSHYCSNKCHSSKQVVLSYMRSWPADAGQAPPITQQSRIRRISSAAEPTSRRPAAGGRAGGYGG